MKVEEKWKPREPFHFLLFYNALRLAVQIVASSSFAMGVGEEMGKVVARVYHFLGEELT